MLKFGHPEAGVTRDDHDDQCVTLCKDANKMKPYPLSLTHFTPVY